MLRSIFLPKTKSVPALAGGSIRKGQSPPPFGKPFRPWPVHVPACRHRRASPSKPGRRNAVLCLRAMTPLPPICLDPSRSEEHTSELQSRLHLVCRLLLEKKKTHIFSHCHS